MKSHIDKTVKVTLLLDEAEAKWLKGVMQNPLQHIECPAAEPETDKEMR